MESVCPMCVRSLINIVLSLVCLASLMLASRSSNRPLFYISIELATDILSPEVWPSFQGNSRFQGNVGRSRLTSYAPALVAAREFLAPKPQPLTIQMSENDLAGQTALID